MLHPAAADDFELAGFYGVAQHASHGFVGVGVAPPALEEDGLAPGEFSAAFWNFLAVRLASGECFPDF